MFYILIGYIGDHAGNLKGTGGFWGLRERESERETRKKEKYEREREGRGAESPIIFFFNF